MSLIIEAERILIEEAAQVLRIAGKGPGDLERAIGRLGQVGGGAAGGFLGGVAGAGVGAGGHSAGRFGPPFGVACGAS
jgi:hypothetical protein